MDRSFLSQPAVVAASRDFICIRLATYEDKQEADFLKTVFIGGSGDLENTTFALLSPQADRYLARPGRGPNFAFRTAAEMAEYMAQLAEWYKVKGKGAPAGSPLPLVATDRLALNVAACDNMPVVLLRAADSQALAKLQEKLAPLAWGKELLGRCAFAVSAGETLPGGVKAKLAEGLVMMAPDSYGQKGAVLAEIPASGDAAALKSDLLAALDSFRPAAKDRFTHIAEGHRRGVWWETKIPVTDPGVPPPGRPR